MRSEGRRNDVELTRCCHDAPRTPNLSSHATHPRHRNGGNTAPATAPAETTRANPQERCVRGQVRVKLGKALTENNISAQPLATEVRWPSRVRAYVTEYTA